MTILTVVIIWMMILVAIFGFFTTDRMMEIYQAQIKIF